ncbi:hypothetical protein [Acetobacter persici]|uniref:hypothetical protein n=1 Tax=Acetobacter persici TaxID=1076596 RepID=UPI001BAA2F15|nr:hypothetical protein [Acetobacter persici]MBS0961499.1 hypothetical protein [Acetobacter persici]
MELGYLLSDHGMVLSYEEGKITQRPLNKITDFENLLIIKDIGFKNYSIKINSNDIFSFNSSLTCDNKAVDDIFIELKYVDQNIFFLNINDEYLSIFPDNSVHTVKQPITWEKFRVLSEIELKKIIYLSQNSLLINGDLYDFTSSSTDYMRFGKLCIPFDDIFSGINEKITEFTFFVEDFPFFARVINPLFVYVVFGKGDIISQFEISIKSLIRFGNYEGDILIATDNKKEINDICEHYGFRNIIFLESTAVDRLDFVGIRLRILSSDAVKLHSPIFYLDADVMIVNDVNRIIKKTSEFDKISAQLENYPFFNNKLKHNISVGSTLYNESPFEIDDVNGFNGGVLFVPSGEKFQNVFEIAYIMLVKYTQKNGRESIPFYEQSVLNYVLYKSNKFSAQPISNITELSCEDLKEDVIFVHYFPAGGERTIHMKNDFEKFEHNLM